MKQAARRPSAVAEARLVFGVDDVLDLEAEGFHGLVELLGQTGVEQRVAQLLTHQEFCGQVADGLVLPFTVSAWVLNQESARWLRTALDAATYTSAGVACSVVTF